MGLAFFSGRRLIVAVDNESGFGRPGWMLTVQGAILIYYPAKAEFAAGAWITKCLRNFWPKIGAVSILRLAIFGVMLVVAALAKADETTVTNVTEAAQWQTLYKRIRTEMGITNVEEMMKIPLFRARFVHPAFGISWDEVPAPTVTASNAMAAVDAFVSTNGWNMQTDGMVFCSTWWPDKSQAIRGLPWTEIRDREFPAVTHAGILYVFFTGWHYNDQGVAYNPNTNAFSRRMAAFKPIGQHWYVWAATDDTGEGPQQYEGTNRPSVEQFPGAIRR
jgi:hypothetical protein